MFHSVTRVRYGIGWFSKNRQQQTLDCNTDKRLSVGSSWSKFGARNVDERKAAAEILERIPAAGHTRAGLRPGRDADRL